MRKFNVSYSDLNFFFWLWETEVKNSFIFPIVQTSTGTITKKGYVCE